MLLDVGVADIRIGDSQLVIREGGQRHELIYTWRVQFGKQKKL